MGFMQFSPRFLSSYVSFTTSAKRLRLRRFLSYFLLGAGLSVVTIACGYRPNPRRPITAATTPTTESAPEQFGVDFPVSIANTNYTISGETAEQLREQMNQLGPKDSNGSFDAFTRWYIRLKYDYETANGSCALDNIRVNVEVTFTMPQWKRDTNFEVGLVERWDRYITALQLHEDGHRDHGIAAGKDVLQVLKQQPSYPSCEELAAAANEAVKQAIVVYNQKDIEYDRETRHGATQGATFP